MAKHASSMQKELYEEPAGVPPGGMGFVSGDVAHPLPYPEKPLTRRGFLKAALISTAAVVAAGGLSWLGYEAARPKVEVNPPTIGQPAPSPNYPTQLTPTMTQEQMDRQYVSEYVSQLAPDLKSYPVAYKATQDQLYDIFFAGKQPLSKYVGKQTLEDTRDSMGRWLNFQIEIDKKGESLFSLDDQELSKIWSDPNVRYNNLRQRMFPIAFLAHNMKLNNNYTSPWQLIQEINDDVDFLIANHTKVWDVVHNPEKYKGQYGQTPLDAILLARNDKENENIEAGYGKSGRQWSEYGKFILDNGSLLEKAPIILHGYSRGLENTMHEDYVERVALYMSSIGGASYRANGTLYPSSDVGDGKIAIPLSDKTKDKLTTVPLYLDQSRTGTLMVDPQTNALPMIYSTMETLVKDKTGYLSFERAGVDYYLYSKKP